MPGVMRATAKLSVTGGHVRLPCKFASVANDSWVCVCIRLAQSSMHVMRGRSGPGLIAVVGASTDLCLCRAVFLYMRACGLATPHVLRGCSPPRRVGEASHVWAEKELLQPSKCRAQCTDASYSSFGTSVAVQNVSAKVSLVVV